MALGKVADLSSILCNCIFVFNYFEILVHSCHEDSFLTPTLVTSVVT